jgi:hypothetical protein
MESDSRAHGAPAYTRQMQFRRRRIVELIVDKGRGALSAL